MTIAQQIVGIVEDTLKLRPNAICKTVYVQVGELRAVIPDSLKFAYKAITNDTILNTSELVIESVPILALCRRCGKTFRIQDFEFACPKCNSNEIEILQGKELHIEKLEVDG